MTITEILHTAQLQLAPVYDTARLDCELLLAYILKKSRTWLHTWPEHHLTPEEQEQFLQLIRQRQNGTPVAYLTGKCEFWSLTLEVDPATLIPRPETELLVEQVLERAPPDTNLQIADLGTGSGAIALSIATELPKCRIVATDRCRTALVTARRNASKYGLTNITFRAGDWYQPLADEQFDIIVSNPPYVASGDPHLQHGDVRFEPQRALAAGTDGLDAIRILIHNGRKHLQTGGWLLIEHGFKQGSAVNHLFQQSGYNSIQCYPDLAGQNRISAGQAI